MYKLRIYLPRSTYWLHKVNTMVTGSGTSEKVQVSWFMDRERKYIQKFIWRELMLFKGTAINLF